MSRMLIRSSGLSNPRAWICRGAANSLGRSAIKHLGAEIGMAVARRSRDGGNAQHMLAFLAFDRQFEEEHEQGRGRRRQLRRHCTAVMYIGDSPSTCATCPSVFCLPSSIFLAASRTRLAHPAFSDPRRTSAWRRRGVIPPESPINCRGYDGEGEGDGDGCN
jgi:hypothetical protein